MKTPPPPQYTTFAPPTTPNPLQRSRELPPRIDTGASNAYNPAMAGLGLAPPIPPRSPDRSSADGSRRKVGHERISSVDSRLAEARAGTVGDQATLRGEAGADEEEDILMSPTYWPGMDRL